MVYLPTKTALKVTNLTQCALEVWAGHKRMHLSGHSDQVRELVRSMESI